MLQNQYQQYQNQYGLSQQPRGRQLESRIVSVEREIDNIYVNIIMDHSNPSYSNFNNPGQVIVITGSDPEDAEYNNTKTTPILDKCSDYYCSVIRYIIPLDEVPLMIMPIVPNQPYNPPLVYTNPNLTPFIVGINYGPTDTSQQVIYINPNAYTNPNPYPPPEQNQLTQVITPYYFVYSYQTLISMVNVAIETAYVSSGIPALLAPTIIPAPYFYLDPVTNLISLIAHKMWSSVFAPLTHIPTLYMNNELITFFDAFFTSFFTLSSPIGKNVGLLLYSPNYPTENMGYALYGTVPTNPPTYYKYTQEYSVLEYWSSLRKIIMTTNTIPVSTEIIPPVGNFSGNTVSYPILADFIPTISTSAGTSRSLIDFIPTSQYKLTDLISDNPLQTIDIRIYWQDREGNLYPLEISVFQQVSIKIAFLRKTLYKGTNLMQ